MKNKTAFQRLWKAIRFWRTKKFKTRKSRKWARDRTVSMQSFCSSIDPTLWKEAVDFSDLFRKKNETRWSKLAADRIGGGGGYPLLYFLCRKIRPKVVVETGVAAGWSSAAILAALDINGNGHLYSSDIPYADRKWSVESVGTLVPENLKHRWSLKIGCDSENLPLILDDCGLIDLFHYDSDKSSEGRDAIFRQVQARMSSQSVFVFDDIQDNFSFRNLVESGGLPHIVFEFLGKNIGVIVFGRAIIIN